MSTTATQIDPRIARWEVILGALEDEFISMKEALPLLEELGDIEHDLERKPAEGE
jgi:hypothetical protein